MGVALGVVLLVSFVVAGRELSWTGLTVTTDGRQVAAGVPLPEQFVELSWLIPPS